MRRLTYLLVVLAAGLCGCRKDQAVPVERPEGEILINMDASVEAGHGTTKALVGSTTGGDYISLKDACVADDDATPDVVEGPGHAIGFWTDMTYVSSDGGEQHRYDVFNPTGAETRLIYDNAKKKWVYEAAKQYWSRGARYNFVAYYPQSMHDHVLQGSSSASVNTFVLTYNTHTVQEDLMVAYNEVCTVDPKTQKPSIYRKYKDDGTTETYKSTVTTTKDSDPNDASAQYGFSQEFNLDHKVPLHFKHTLAAVQVRFRFGYDDTDELLGCRFENTAESGFHTVGTLVFGVGSRESERPAGGFTTLLEQERFEHDEKENFAWTTYQTTFEDVPMYFWDVTDNKGIPFGMAGQAVAYTSSYEVKNDDGTSTETPLNLTAEGQKFVNHDGWILILPQKSPGTVRLMYKLKNNVDKMAPITIPAYTGTDIYGYGKGETRADGTVVKEEECTHYVAGHRYVYTVTVNETNAYASVMVEPWNELFSSTEVIF